MLLLVFTEWEAKAPINGFDNRRKAEISNWTACIRVLIKIVVTFIGYPTKTFQPIITTDSKPDNNMGMVLVSQTGSKTLKEVVVTGQGLTAHRKPYR